MPAYLTHAMILIRTERWLRDMKEGLEGRQHRLAASGQPLTPFDDKMLGLSRKALAYLRPEGPDAAADALAPALIENGVGAGISKYAYVGSLGPDFPGAGHIFALNQRWASRQLHNGAPRRAWVDAKSTTFLLKYVEGSRSPAAVANPTLHKRHMAYALGHVTHVAADALIHPFVHRWVWDERARGGEQELPWSHLLFELQVDAKVAEVFFRRSSLHGGQSWEHYYLEKGAYENQIVDLVTVYTDAFRAAYGSDKPTEAVCGAAQPAECRAPQVKPEFLVDGYRNTVNWAIDTGYDHDPLWWWYWVWTGAIVGAGIMYVRSVANATNSAGTITNSLFDVNADQIARMTAEAQQHWREAGYYDAKNEALWHTTVSGALSWSDHAAKPVKYLFDGGFPMLLLTAGQLPDGLFGQGKAGMFDQGVPRGLLDLLLTLKGGAFMAAEEIAPEPWDDPVWRWINLTLELGENFFEHFWFKKTSLENNVEGETLGHALWGPKMILALSYAASAMVIMGIKSRGDGDERTRRAGFDGVDLALSFIVPAAISGGFVWTGVLDRYLFKEAAGVTWPDTKTDKVDAYLPSVAVAGADPDRTFGDIPGGAGARRFTAAGALGLPALVMPNAKLVDVAGRKHFPEDTAPDTAWAERPAKDMQHRLAESAPYQPTGGGAAPEYTLAGLFDEAVRLSGLLVMAAVNYDEATGPVREHVKTVFKDWNLDYRTFAEWEDLVGAAGVSPTPLLRAVRDWETSVKDLLPATDAATVARLEGQVGVTDLAGGLYADFARTRTSIDLPGTRTRRLTRPGAILLPNLDLDAPPAPPLPSPLPSRAALVDALRDAALANADDVTDLATVRVRKSPASTAPTHSMVVRVHADDARRIRAFEKVAADPPTAWPPRLGEALGGTALTEHEIAAAAPESTELVVEALTLPGDPTRRAPTGPVPLAPAPDAPGGVTPGAPAAPDRLPGEVWVEVVHKEGGIEVPGMRDTALFTIAPFILLSNLQPVERIYITTARDQFVAGNLILPGNHATVADLLEALQSDPAFVPHLTFPSSLAPAPVGNTFLQFDAHRPLPPGDPSAAKMLYLVDGNSYGSEVRNPAGTQLIRTADQWVQDEFELGYCWAPHASMHVVVHSPRSGDTQQLGAFVVSELAEPGLGLYNGVSRAPEDSLDFGGNIEVSGPVAAATPAQPLDAGGPPIPAHPPAPFGKIILGEGLPKIFDIAPAFSADLDARSITAALMADFAAKGFAFRPGGTVDVVTAGSEWEVTDPVRRYRLRVNGGRIDVHFVRRLDRNHKALLEAQRVQPIVTVDTSWLKVGHVDEFMSIVPAPNDPNPAKRRRLLMASSLLAVHILEAAKARRDSGPGHPLTDAFRRRTGDSMVRSMVSFQMAFALPFSPSRTRVNTLLTAQRAFNVDLEVKRLLPIRNRLEIALGLAADEVVETPVLFGKIETAFMDRLGALIDDGKGGFTDARTAALSPAMVNLLVVNDHLMIPKPFGPRMGADDAAFVLGAVGVTAAGGAAITGADLAPLVEHDDWARRGTTAAALAAAFGVSAGAITGHAKNAGKFTGGAVTQNWDKIHIPEPNVDLFEAHAFATLGPPGLGLKLHFIDDWDWYHVLDGEVHCGTNVKRAIPERAVGYAGPFWWDHYPVGP